MPPERPLTKRQVQAAATQEQLLNAAREVFEARGYQAASVGAITELAETAHGTFYLYFRNKDDAFAKVMASVIAELFREASSPWVDEPYEGIEVATRGFLRVYAEHKGLWRCLLEGMLQSPAIESMWLELRRGFTDRIAHSLEHQQAVGLVRPFDATLAANALGSMAEWFGFTHLVLGEPPVDDRSMEAAVRILTDLWYHAVYGGAPPVAGARGGSPRGALRDPPSAQVGSGSAGPTWGGVRPEAAPPGSEPSQ